MQIERIIEDLRAEHARLSTVIQLLDPTQAARRGPGRPAAQKTGGGITPAGRKRLSEAMVARWRQRRIMH